MLLDLEESKTCKAWSVAVWPEDCGAGQIEIELVLGTNRPQTLCPSIYALYICFKEGKKTPAKKRPGSLAH